jgi:hypothetical protein
LITIRLSFCLGFSSKAERKLMAGQSTILLDNWHTIFRGTDKQQLTAEHIAGQPMDISTGELSEFCDGDAVAAIPADRTFIVDCWMAH